jgi:CHAD domain-containing protein
MNGYVREQTSTLLRRLAYQVAQMGKTADADEIHDLRVAIRRLNRCLQVFAEFYPTRARKKVRRKLSEMMDGAAEVRDRDIAVELLREAGMPKGATAFRVLEQERAEAAEALVGILKHWKHADFSRKWRGDLSL